MAEFKGTKQPWRTSVDLTEVTASKVGILEGSKQICTVSTFCKTEEEVHANAKLIAAAPDLLEALQAIFPHAALIVNVNHPAHKMALEAIKKATE